MRYKEEFLKIIERMDNDFNWTINFDMDLINKLIKNEISEEHELYNKKIEPIAISKNKYDLLVYYKSDNNKDVILTIHFNGYRTNNKKNPSFEEYINFFEACQKIVLIYNEIYLNSRYNSMLDSEIVKREKCYSALKGLYTIMPVVYDVLFKMNEFRGKLAKENDQNLIQIQDVFQFFSFDFPFKIRSIFLLAEIGNYNDACIVLRSLTETFFYFKYYIIKNNGKKLREYINQDKKSSIRIKDIMDFIAPSYYETIYKDLCKFAHGNPLITGVFRGNVSKEDPLKYNFFNINLDWYSYVINLTLPLVFGYIEMYNIVYNHNTLKVNNSLCNNIEIIKKYIISDMKERYEIFPKQQKMIELYGKIISFENK